MKITEKAAAKINLTLDVTGVLPNGYHELCMVMQTIDLYDYVTVECADEVEASVSASGITLTMNTPLPDKIPPEKNLVYKAAMLMKETYNIKEQLNIYLEKNIPAAAGLAGGSADCAATLRAIKALFKLPVSDEELAALSVKLGADVPFCVLGNTRLCEGIGEKMTKLRDLPKIQILLMKPKTSVATEGVYKAYDRISAEQKIDHPDNPAMLRAIENGDPDGIAASLGNVLEYVTIPNNEIIRELKDEMLKCGALNSLMSGSGPSVYGLYADEATRDEAYEFLKNKYPTCDIFKVQPI